MAALDAATPVLRGCARTIEGCRPVGFTMPGKPQIGVRNAAIPVLAGVGRGVGVLTPRECALDVNRMTSSEVQQLRDSGSRARGGWPDPVMDE